MRQRVLYLDTEDVRVNRVKAIVKDTLEHCELIHVDSVESAYKVLLERTIDIFIVNVVLNASDVSGTEGLHFVSCIREIPQYIMTPVILFSSLQDPQLYACGELNCIGYLSKPCSGNKLKNLLEKVSHFRTQRNAERFLVFRKNRVIYPVLIKDIVYIVREKSIAYVHMEKGDVLEVPYLTCAKILYEAGDDRLFMCNRSTIVNRDYVYAVDPTNSFIVLRDKRGMFDIGARYRSGVLAEFSVKNEILCETADKKKQDEYFVKRMKKILAAVKADERDNSFVVRNHNVRFLVKVRELVYVRYFDRALHLYMSTGDVFVVDQRPVQMVLELAHAKCIVQCGRGTLVNLAYVDTIDFKNKKIVLQSKEILKIGDAYIKQLQQAWIKKK